MMRAKKILVGLALLIACGGVFAVVDRQMRQRQSAVETAVVDWDAVEDDPNEKLQISWMSVPRYPMAREGTWIEQMMEERFNVEFKPLFISHIAYLRRRPLIFAGGDVPDVFYDGDPVIVQRDAYHGFALEVPYEVILKHAPNYTRYLNQYAPHAWLYAHWNGRNYGIPTYAPSLGYPVPGVWRMDWLRKVGIDKAPETLDEMYTALWKFRHEDPDGNGVKDTYGWCPNAQAWYNVFAQVFGAYGILPYDWMLKDGEVVWGGALPESKEVLGLLRDWYAEGLIDPDFVICQVKSSPIPYQKFISGTNGFIVTGGNYHSFDKRNKASLVSVITELHPEAELVPGRFPVGPAGLRGTRIWSNAAHVFAFGSHMAATPEKVIRMLKIFEALATDEELFLASRMGKEGVHWEFDEELGLRHLPPYDERNAAQKHVLNLTLDGASGFFSPCAIRSEIADKYLAAEYLQHRSKYQKPEWGIADVFGKVDVVPSSIKYLRDLRNLQMTVYAEIVRGDRELDYFGTFVEQWMALGGAEMLQQAQELLEIRDEIFQRVGVSQVAMAGSN
jgi:putative aldouronate transport system substrate-binding protein